MKLYFSLTRSSVVLFILAAGATTRATNDDLFSDGIANLEFTRQIVQVLVLIGVEHHHHIDIVVADECAIIAVLERFLPSCHYFFGVVISQLDLEGIAIHYSTVLKTEVISALFCGHWKVQYKSICSGCSSSAGKSARRRRATHKTYLV